MSRVPTNEVQNSFNDQGLTRDIIYLDSPESVNGRTIQHHALPSNGSTFTMGKQLRLEIPCGRPGNYWNQKQSYLMMDVTAATADCYFDGDASCMIELLEVYHASNRLTTLSGYNLLHAIHNDFTVPTLERATNGEFYGASALSRTVATPGGTAATDIKAAVEEGLATLTTNRRGHFFDVSVAAQTKRKVVIPLINALVGTLAPKYLPLGMMGGGGDLRCELTLDSVVNAFVSAGTPGITVDNVRFVCELIEVDGMVDQLIASNAPNGILSYHFEDFQRFTASIDTANNYVIPIPAKFSNLRTMFLIHRGNATPGGGDTAVSKLSQDAYTITGRERADLTSYFFRIGSQRVPATPVDCGSANVPGVQSYMELKRAFHALNSSALQNMNTLALYNATHTAADGEGTFCVGIDLDMFTHKDTIRSGIDTRGVQCFFEGTYDTAVASTVDIFCHFTSKFVLDLNVGVAITEL